MGVGTLPFDGEARKLHLNVLRDITTERERQDAKWGQQNHADGDIDFAWAQSEERYAKRECEEAAKAGNLTWYDIEREESAEAMVEVASGNKVRLREELVQHAAVLVAWIECLDRKASKKP